MKEVPNTYKCIFKHLDTECKIRKVCDGKPKRFCPRTEISNLKYSFRTERKR